MRAFEVSLTTVSKRWDRHPEMRLSQAPGSHEFRYLIYPHKGTWDTGEVLEQAEWLSTPLEPAQAGRHGGTLPQTMGLVELSGANVALAALKRSEDGEALLLRVFNPSGKRQDARLTFYRSFSGRNR
jgi:alpha-mannosidase